MSSVEKLFNSIADNRYKDNKLSQVLRNNIPIVYHQTEDTILTPVPVHGHTCSFSEDVVSYIVKNILSMNLKVDDSFHGNKCIKAFPEISTAIFSNCDKKEAAALLISNQYDIGLIAKSFTEAVCLRRYEGVKGHHFAVTNLSNFFFFLKHIPIKSRKEGFYIHKLSTHPHILPSILNSSQLIGEGSSSLVYGFDNHVIKIMDISNPEDERSSYREVCALLSLQTKVDFTPRLIDYGYFNGVFMYIIMSRVRGEKVTNKLINKLGIDRFKDIVKKLYNAGYDTNDITARNMIYSSTEDKLYVYDFGLASRTNESLEHTGLSFLEDELVGGDDIEDAPDGGEDGDY